MRKRCGIKLKPPSMRRTLSGLRTFFFIMAVTLLYYLSHSRDGESAPPQARQIHKNGIERWYSYTKDSFLPPWLASYTMPAALWKMDHPCFFDSNRIYDDFRPRGGLFFLFRSADIFAGPRDDFFVCRRADTHRSSRPGPGSNAGKYKTSNRTIDIGVEAITKQTCLRSCKPPEGALGWNLSVGLPAVCGSSFPKARS